MAPIGKSGTGHSLYWFNTFKRLGMIEGDAFDKRFENVLRGASAQYRFGDLSEMELREAISRCYVREWDWPLLAHRERSGDWAVAMSGREVVKGAAWQAGLAVGGQALAAFWRLFKVPAALGPANSRLATTKSVTGEGQQLFRVVNDSERAGIDHCGRFSFPREGSTPTGNPGKFFWGSIDEAKQFQSYWYRSGESSHLLRTTIKPDAKPWLGPALTDGVGHPYFVDMLDLTAPIYWVP
jgi:hypothetical protein